MCLSDVAILYQVIFDKDARSYLRHFHFFPNFNSDSDTGDNSKDVPSRGAPHLPNGGKNGAHGVSNGAGEDPGFGTGVNGVALTPKQLKKQLKGECEEESDNAS